METATNMLQHTASKSETCVPICADVRAADYPIGACDEAAHQCHRATRVQKQGSHLKKHTEIQPAQQCHYQLSRSRA